MSLIKNLFDKVIQIQTKIIERLDSKIQLDSNGNVPDSIAIAYSKQKHNDATSSTIMFKNDISIYNLDIKSSTSLVFDCSQLNLQNQSYVFQLWISMSGSYSITFPSNISWLNDQMPDISNTGTLYCVVVRVLPAKFGSTSTSPKMIGNLAYSHSTSL